MFFVKYIAFILASILLPTISQACDLPELPYNAVNILDHGAVAGDGLDDTESIQKAIDATPEGGTLYVPSGRFLINAVREGLNQWKNPATLYGIYPHSNMTILLAQDATLEAIPNGEEKYSVISLENVENVLIAGGTIRGERNGHLGIEGEWGHVLGIWSSQNIEIIGTTIVDAWGDGIYIWDVSGNRTNNIKLCKVIVDNNRRQGLGVVGADNVLIEESKFTGTNGYSPEAGINCEPNPEQQVTNVIIRNCEIVGNFGTGVRFDGVDSVTYNNTLEGSIVKNNGSYGVYIENSKDNIIKKNLIENNGTSQHWSAAITLKNALNTLIENNSVRDNFVENDNHRGVLLVELSSGINLNNNDICIDVKALSIDDRSEDHAYTESNNSYCTRTPHTLDPPTFLFLLLR